MKKISVPKDVLIVLQNFSSLGSILNEFIRLFQK